MCCNLALEFSVGIGAFFVGLSQIFSFFSFGLFGKKTSLNFIGIQKEI